MSTFAVLLVAVLAACVLALQAWRLGDRLRDDRAWRALAARAAPAPPRFEPAMVDGLPEPARRFFRYTIAPGAPLHAVAVVEMTGEIGLGDRETPRYQPMRARQIIAPPHGLVWRLAAGRGAMRIAGSDGALGTTSWTRFWLLGCVPVARAGGPDHARSAFGRVAAEAVFFAPATLLPSHGVSWEAVDGNTARATVAHAGMTQSVDVTVAPDGRPERVVIERWSDANPDRVYRLQPFGGELSGFRDFDGFRLPARIEGGNFIGTPDYFPFYRARIERISFPPAPADTASG